MEQLELKKKLWKTRVERGKQKKDENMRELEKKSAQKELKKAEKRKIERKVKNANGPQCLFKVKDETISLVDLKFQAANGLRAGEVKPKKKMWKMQARKIAKAITDNNMPITEERPSEILLMTAQRLKVNRTKA